MTHRDGYLPNGDLDLSWPHGFMTKDGHEARSRTVLPHRLSWLIGGMGEITATSCIGGGYDIIPRPAPMKEETQEKTHDEIIAWLNKVHAEVGVTPALRAAYEEYQRWEDEKSSDPSPPNAGSLFQFGDFTLRSGDQSGWKIDCDALTDADLAVLASIAAQRLPPFGSVEGIPTGGLRFAAELLKYVKAGGSVLLVDDVLTTGASIEKQRAGRNAIGVVIFARGKCPDWVTPLFQMTLEKEEEVATTHTITHKPDCSFNGARLTAHPVCDCGALKPVPPKALSDILTKPDADELVDETYPLTDAIVESFQDRLTEYGYKQLGGTLINDIARALHYITPMIAARATKAKDAELLHLRARDHGYALEVAELKAECHSFAANLCDKPYSHEHGGKRCEYQDEIKAKDAEIERLNNEISNLTKYAEEHAQEIADDMKEEADDFDKDLWRALRYFLAHQKGFDFNDYQDGISADDVREWLTSSFASYEETEERLRAALREAAGLTEKAELELAWIKNPSDARLNAMAENARKAWAKVTGYDGTDWLDAVRAVLATPEPKG